MRRCVDPPSHRVAAIQAKEALVRGGKLLGVETALRTVLLHQLINSVDKCG